VIVEAKVGEHGFVKYEGGRVNGKCEM